MKKYLCIVPVSALSILLLLAGGAGPAFAAPARSSVPARYQTSTSTSQRGWHPRSSGHWHYGAPLINNQYFHGNASSGNIIHSIGNNINNTGNEGWNRHSLQDESSNGGNEIVNQHPDGYRINNQHFVGNGNFRNSYFFQGNNQGNSGNEGLNDGVVQDNSTNGGNQILN